MESFNIRVIEAMEIPEEYEAKFLRDIAEKLGLQFPCYRIFTERLSEKNRESEWSEIVESLPSEVSGVTEKSARQHYWSREICPKLKEWGFTYEPATKKLWLSARQWLAQTQFEPWLWEQLVEKSQPTQQMGFLEVKETPGVPTLGARREPSKRYCETVKLGSEVILEINLTERKHLTLLEREPNGTVVCLCPSEYAPDTLLSGQTERIPQPSAPYPTFAATEKGKEQWLALLTRETPALNWLKQSRWEALELQPSQLQEMFEYVNETPQARLLYTEYEVV